MRRRFGLAVRSSLVALLTGLLPGLLSAQALPEGDNLENLAVIGQMVNWGGWANTTQRDAMIFPTGAHNSRIAVRSRDVRCRIHGHIGRWTRVNNGRQARQA